MTREEAIKISKGLRYDFKCDSELMVDFCNIVLDALQTEPCENAISRKAVIKAIRKLPEVEIVEDGFWTHKMKDTCHKSSLLEDIKELPSVQPKAKTGKWIWEINETPSTPVSPYELNYAGWVCSCCHEFPDDICEWDDPDELPTYKFCPNCGAEMESEDKG